MHMRNMKPVVFSILILFQIYHRAFFHNNSNAFMENLFVPNPILIQCEFGSGKVLFTECICQSINCSILKCPSSREQLLQVLYKQLLRLLNLLITAENSAWYPNYVCYKECLCQNCQQQAAFYIPPPLPLCNALETKQIQCQ